MLTTFIVVCILNIVRVMYNEYNSFSPVYILGFFAAIAQVIAILATWTLIYFGLLVLFTNHV